MQSQAHSSIGASSYYRWKACPGSVRLSQGIQSFESAYAKEGILAHEIAARALTCHFFDPMERAVFPPNMPEDFAPSVKEYVEYVKKLARRVSADSRPGKILIEHKFDLSDIYPGLFGTADAVVYDEENKKLFVIDYKHGAGIPVEVENNLQLMYYGLGALNSTAFPCDKVVLIIIQPRCDHVGGTIREWEFQSLDLIEFAADLHDDAARTAEPNAPLHTGKHCRFCPAAASKCDAIKSQAQALAKLEFSQSLSYDPEKLSQALSFLPTLEAWIKGVREFAYGEAIHGRSPKGWKLVDKRATRSWVAPEDQVVDYVMRAARVGSEACYEKKIKSPAQMEKLLPKDDLLKAMMKAESSGYALVSETDKRPPAKVDPKTQFTAIEGE